MDMNGMFYYGEVEALQKQNAIGFANWLLNTSRAEMLYNTSKSEWGYYIDEKLYTTEQLYTLYLETL